MRVAALYDIHANLPALEAVLEDIARARVDRIVIGGDVLPGPMPAETLAALAAIDVPVDAIAGNGEIAVLEIASGREPKAVPEAHRDPIRWAVAQLTAAQLEQLRGWPATLRLQVDGIGEVLFCHATPRDDNEIFTRRTAEHLVAPAFAGVDAALVVCGHTHMPFDRTIAGRRVVNAGSVGMSFSGRGAHWLLVGGGVEFRRTAYALEAAAARVRATAYPEAEAFAAKYVLDPPTETQMLELFSRAEMKEATAQKPDFSGVWSLNVQASALDRRVAPAVRGGTLRIAHHEPRVAVRLEIVFDRGPFVAQFERESDGRAITASDPDEGDTVSSLRWDGDALLFVDRGGPAGADVTISFRYELEGGGGRLRAVEQLRGGGRDQDNVWVFDRV